MQVKNIFTFGDSPRHEIILKFQLCIIWYNNQKCSENCSMQDVLTSHFQLSRREKQKQILNYKLPLNLQLSAKIRVSKNKLENLSILSFEIMNLKTVWMPEAFFFFPVRIYSTCHYLQCNVNAYYFLSLQHDHLKRNCKYFESM